MAELKYAWRMLWRMPALSLVAILSLALGLGANTTIFSFADALMFRQPPVEQPQRLAELWLHDPQPDAALNGLYPLSYPGYLDFSARNRSFSGVAVYQPGAEANVAISGAGAAAWPGQLVSANYFSVLGIQPALGRWFAPDEGSTAGRSPVVVLSYNNWRARFGGSPSAVGRTVTMNGAPFTVIGVAPKGFAGLFAGLKVDYWAPLTMTAQLGSPGTLTDRGQHSLMAIGRLKPGVALAAASADVNAIERALAHTYPHNYDPRWGGKATPVGMVPTPFRGFVGAGAGLLAVVVGLILLIACANAALVLLVGAMARRREWALRAALGASRGRLVRQALAASVMLALIAGGLGLLLAWWLGPLLLRLKPPGFPIALQLGLDGRVLAFTFGLAVVAGVLFGLAPAWHGARQSLAANLKDGQPGAGAGRSRARSTFIVAQLAICMVVLVGAALCLRSLQRANQINPGFDTQHLVFAQLNPSSLGYSGPTAQAFYQRVRAAVGRIAQVQAVSFVTVPPLQLSESDTSVLPPGMTPPPHEPGFDVQLATVAPDYFQASGTRLLAGRDFTAADLAPGHQPPVVVNALLAQKFWPGKNAVGQSLLMHAGNASRQVTATVVGVAENGKYGSLGEQPRTFLFQLAQIAEPAWLVARVAGSPAAALPGIQRTLEQLDPNLTGDGIETVQQYMQVPLFPARFTGILLAGFAGLALLLAIVGLYGVISASVAQRTREYGIRMALGADRAALLAQVLGQGLRLAAWGLLAGAVAAALLTRLMSALLYGMTPLDPASYLIAAAVLVAVALAASYLPARRATKVDPLIALRSE
ncbi:MAG: ABC transporter permease [Terriglobales bacterium]